MNTLSISKILNFWEEEKGAGTTVTSLLEPTAEAQTLPLRANILGGRGIYPAGASALP